MTNKSAKKKGKNLFSLCSAHLTRVCTKKKLKSFSFLLKCNLGNAGDLSVWEFSGVETYHMVYDHFIGNTNCIHTIVFNVEDKAQVQLEQVRYWLHFLQSRIPPVEPLGNRKFFSFVLHIV